METESSLRCWRSAVFEAERKIKNIFLYVPKTADRQQRKLNWER